MIFNVRFVKTHCLLHFHHFVRCLPDNANICLFNCFSIFSSLVVVLCGIILFVCILQIVEAGIAYSVNRFSNIPIRSHFGTAPNGTSGSQVILQNVPAKFQKQRVVIHFWTKIFHNYEPGRMLTQIEQLGAVPERLRTTCMRTDYAEKGAPTSTTCTSFM